MSVEINLDEALAAGRLVLLWFLIGVAGLTLSVFFYLWTAGR